MTGLLPYPSRTLPNFTAEAELRMMIEYRLTNDASKKRKGIKEFPYTVWH